MGCDGPVQRALGVHRVLDPAGVLPQAARRLDADPAIGPDEVRIAVQRLNLDAASFRQLSGAYGGDGARSGPPSWTSSPTRGKMQNPVTGSGGMLIGVVDAVGPESPLGLAVGDRVATLVSLTLTPLRDHRRAGPLGRPVGAGPGRGDGDPVRPLDRRRPARRPARRSLARRPGRVRRARPPPPAWSSGARRAVGDRAWAPRASPAACRLAAARAAGATELTGLVRTEAEAAALPPPDWPTGWWSPTPPTRSRSPRPSATPADVTVVCVDVPGAEHGADPGDGRRGHRGLLLHGDVVPGGRPGRGGDGGGRDDAGRQRLHAGARRPGPRSLPPAPPACGRSSTRGCAA